MLESHNKIYLSHSRNQYDWNAANNVLRLNTSKILRNRWVIVAKAMMVEQLLHIYLSNMVAETIIYNSSVCEQNLAASQTYKF